MLIRVLKQKIRIRCIIVKVRDTPCIFKSARVPGEFRENSRVFGEKTFIRNFFECSHELFESSR